MQGSTEQPRRDLVQMVRDRAQALFEAERKPHEGLPGNSNASDRAHLFADGNSDLVCIDSDRMSAYYRRAAAQLRAEGAFDLRSPRSHDL